MPTKIRVLEEEEAIEPIVHLLGSRRFIRINGHSGHGKTRLAKAITARLGWPRFSLDEYLPLSPPRRPYHQLVDTDRLRSDLAAMQDKGAVVEGIWLDQLVPVDRFGAELKIYMLSLFSPEYELDERMRRRQFRTPLYHREYRPDFWAEIVILKVAG